MSTRTASEGARELAQKIDNRLFAVKEENWLESLTELIDEEMQEFRHMCTCVLSGVGDVRKIVAKKEPMHVISIPILYGTLAKCVALLEKWDPKLSQK